MERIPVVTNIPEVVHGIWANCQLSAGQYPGWPIYSSPEAGGSENSGGHHGDEGRKGDHGPRCLYRDARIAIGSLRAAARDADEQGLDRITDDLIEEGIPEAQAEIRQKHVQKLTEHQRVLYDIIVERGEIAPGELYEAYCERVDDPKTRRMVRNHLQKMQRYNLVQADGESRSRTYSLVS